MDGTGSTVVVGVGMCSRFQLELICSRWLVSKAEYEKLGTAGSQGFAKIGWKGNKLNCSLSRKDMHVISILIATF